MKMISHGGIGGTGASNITNDCQHANYWGR